MGEDANQKNEEVEKISRLYDRMSKAEKRDVGLGTYVSLTSSEIDTIMKSLMVHKGVILLNEKWKAAEKR